MVKGPNFMRLDNESEFLQTFPMDMPIYRLTQDLQANYHADKDTERNYPIFLQLVINTGLDKEYIGSSYSWVPVKREALQEAYELCIKQAALLKAVLDTD